MQAMLLLMSADKPLFYVPRPAVVSGELVCYGKEQNVLESDSKSSC